MSTACGSPILSVPPEIIGIIFRHCLPSDLPPSWVPWPSPHKAPLLLAQICHQWREICLDTPELWTSIAFGDTKSVELLKQWLSRARNQPLTVALYCGDEMRASMRMDIIKSYCSQWKNLCLTLPMDALCQLNTSTLPRLERLSLNAPFRSHGEISTAPVIIPNAPLLREVETSGMGIPMIVAFLRCCPNLLDLSITSNGIDDSVYQHLELRCLRSLKIQGRNFLPRLTLPRLERLEILPGVDDIDAATHTFQSLVSLSCDLQSLSLGICSGTTTQLRRFLCVANTLHHLTLQFTPFTKIKPEIAIQALHGVGVLPGLKHLEIHDSYYLSKIEYCPPLMDMLMWRREHAALESFELFPGAHILPAAIMDEFRILGETGLQLRVTARNWHHAGFVDVPLLDTHPTGSHNLE
ncbi:hypothetical protein B0H13DRAFT_2264482 [Mycena leptocephala]|nr:hypothetical protein B0H13DRAFT_2264482 [Mycena leptocephala]